MTKSAVALLLLAGSVMAQEGSEAAHGASEGVSPIWTWLNFLILLVVLGWLISKHLGPALTARSREIHEGLAAGERAKAEAEARSAAVQARLAGLEATIAEMRAQSHEELARETERIRRDTAAEMARVEQTALQDAESAGKLAKLEVQRYAAQLAIELAEQKVRARMSSEKQAELVGNFSAALANGSLR